MAETVRLVFLGGLGEIGRNCMAVEQGVGDSRRILLIDCGLMFPGPDLHGIDLVLPDFTYLRENAERIDAIAATHGHEDHVGGIQFLLREVSVPIYGSAVTLGLARNRIEEAGLLGRTSLNRVERRRAAADRRRSTSSSSPSPTASPTPTPSPCTPRRASCCTPATSSST